jgi:hypothetical protein
MLSKISDSETFVTTLDVRSICAQPARYIERLVECGALHTCEMKNKYVFDTDFETKAMGIVVD